MLSPTERPDFPPRSPAFPFCKKELTMKLTGQITEKGLNAFTQKAAMQAGRKKPRIWVVVADKGIARIFRKQGSDLDLICEAAPENLTQITFCNKNVGRMVSNGGGVIRHKYEPHMEESRQDVLLFAHDLADWLDQVEAADAFDRLVLIAAPRMLGDLRAVITKSVQRRIVAEIDKDLTKLGETALRNALDKIFWF